MREVYDRINSIIGTKYRRPGSNEGMNCTEVVAYVYPQFENEMKIAADPFSGDFDIITVTDIVSRGLKEVEKPINGSIVAFYSEDGSCYHVGAFIDNHVVHAARNAGVIIEEISVARLRSKELKFFVKKEV